MSNIRGNAAFGDIFTVNTPYIDRAGQQIYADEQRRQLQQQKQSDEMDKQLASSVTRLKPADVNEYVDKYQEWKQAKMNLNRMPAHNSKAHIAAQLDANQKLADLSILGANSIKANNDLKTNSKIISSDKTGEYKDEAPSMISQAYNTPTSQYNTLTTKDDNGNVVPFDPANIEHYKYPGNMQKWQPILKGAKGTPTVKTTEQTPFKENGLTGVETKEVKAVNSPLEFYNQTVGSLVGAGSQKSLNATFKFTDDQANQIVQDYNDKILKNPLAQKAWGEGVKLPTNALLTPATRTVALMAMQHALTNLPEESKPSRIYDRGSVINKNEAYGYNKQAIGEANTRSNQIFSVTHRVNNGNGFDENLVQSMSNAVKSGDTDAIKKTFSKLNGGNGKYVDVEFQPAGTLDKNSGIPSITKTPTVTVKTNEYDPHTKSSFIQNSVYDANDPLLADKLRGVIVHTTGKNAALTKEILGGNKTAATDNSNVKVNIGGKIYAVPKSNLQKMDKDKVSYKLVQ